MKKNFIVLLIVAILCSGMVFAANEGRQKGVIAVDELTKKPVEDPTLTLQWTLDTTVQTYEFGFTETEVNERTEGAITPKTSLGLNQTKTATDIHADASAYVYWVLDTTDGVVIKMSGTGPLKTGAGTLEADCISWQATFNPVTVDTEGKMSAAPSATKIGKTTNATDGTDADYSTPVAVLTMTDDNAKKGTQLKKGSALIEITTQNVHPDLLDTDKTQGPYAASLVLTIEAAK